MFRSSLLALVCLLGLAVSRSAAQTGTQHEYELKAAVLYHIIEYVEWPGVSTSAQSPAIQIGLLGQFPFVDALELLGGKTIQGRKVVVRKVTGSRDAQDCQVVFISASEKPRIPEIVSELKGRPILTVSEIDGFAERGGMVNLVTGQNRIVMEINRQMTAEARLNISSQLLKLARVLPK